MRRLLPGARPDFPTMKRKAVLLSLSLLALSLSIAAQTSGMPPGHQMLADPDKFADGHMAALDQQIHLSADQKAKMRPVFLDEGKKLFAVMNDNNMSDGNKQAAIQKLHTQTAQKIDSLLTPAQRKQMSPAAQPGTKSQPNSQT